MPGSYELKRSGPQFMWNLRAANGEIILTSERYHTSASAREGIASCQRNSPMDARYERRTSSANEPYFVLRAVNHEVLGTSEMYAATAGMENGIASCKVNGPTVTIVDRT